MAGERYSVAFASANPDLTIFFMVPLVNLIVRGLLMEIEPSFMFSDEDDTLNSSMMSVFRLVS